MALLCTLPVPAEVAFHSSWDGGWAFRTTGEFCELTLEVAEYGQARFVATPDDPVSFEFQARRDLHGGDLAVFRHAPEWHPAGAGVVHLGQAAHVPGGGAVVRGPLARNMLVSLREGFDLALSAPPEYDPDARLAVWMRAKSVNPALGEFLACAHTAVSVSWADMSRTRIVFEVDKHDLSPEAEARLHALARFVRQDPTITSVYVDGHTDASGTRAWNHQLSKRRAEAVAAYLRSLGVTDRNVVVRFHGAAYPVASNDTAAGKAENRRTTVRLERDAPETLASH